jgi:hypothetical protein
MKLSKTRLQQLRRHTTQQLAELIVARQFKGYAFSHNYETLARERDAALKKYNKMSQAELINQFSEYLY